MTKLAPFLKRGIDLSVAVTLAIVLLPLLMTISLTILFTMGWPIIFTQRRIGAHGETFTIVKFRTMIRSADQFLNEDLTASAPRVTRFGRILRRFSLDELPQLVNIIRGEMSLIGPRAALPEVHDQLTPTQQLRTRVRPGVTGLAQVNGRNEIPWSERCRLDNYYIENYSLGLDLRILVQTPLVWFTGRGFEVDRSVQRIDAQMKDPPSQELHE